MTGGRIWFYIAAGLAIVLTIVTVDGVVRNFRSAAGGLVSGGQENGEQSLLSCPDTPNCVSSYPGSGYADLSPWDYTGHSREHARETLLRVLRDLPRTELQTVRDDYIHAVYRSRLFRFRDDLEFHLPDPSGGGDNPHIDFRAASRVGKGDLGVHEKRMTRLAEEFSSKL